MLNCGLGVILGRERCPHDLEGSSSGTPSPCFHFSSTPSAVFCVTRPPHPPHPWGGRGGLSFLRARRTPRPPVTQGAMGGPLLAPGPGEGHAGRAEGRAAGDGGREAARPALLPDARVLPLPAQLREPSVDSDLLDPLGGDGRADCGESPISRPPGSTAVSGCPVTLAGPCSAGTRGLPERTRRWKWAHNPMSRSESQKVFWGSVGYGSDSPGHPGPPPVSGTREESAKARCLQPRVEGMTLRVPWPLRCSEAPGKEAPWACH